MPLISTPFESQKSQDYNRNKIILYGSRRYALRFKSSYFITAITLLYLSLAVTSLAYAQTPTVREYVVQAEDWLSKLAEKEYGDPMAYPAIVEATNAKATEDNSFATIDNPDIIEVGQKLWLPDEAGAGVAETTGPESTEAEATAGKEAPATTPVGIYKAMTPAASSPGIDSTLYINTDNTVRLVEDYLNGEPLIIEVGNWQLDGDQLTVTLTGREGGEVYPTPTEVTFTWIGNILPSTPDEDTYGSAGREYMNFDTMAKAQLTPPYDPAAAQALIDQNGLAGIYKGFSPAASCCGLDWTLFLNPDNKATLKSDYLNGEAPLLEQGTWSVTDNTLTVNLDGAEKPLTFKVADGVLISNDFSIFGQEPVRLYRFDVIAQNVAKASSD
jgi:uncharacterized lipoprotein NlpE involved in copper resistance